MKKIIFILFLSILNVNAGDLEKGVKAMKGNNTFKAIKYLKKSCNNQEAKGCYLIALYYDHTNVEQDRVIAQNFYLKACDLSYKKGCYLLDAVGAYGKRDIEDYQKAKQVFEDDCINNNAKGCNRLAIMYLFGQGVVRDYSIGKSYLKKACNLGDKYSCDSYAKLN